MIAGRDISMLVQQQLTSLYRFARGVTGCAQDAEDLVHDSCVKALGAAKTVRFESEKQFNIWLRRILINTYRDHYRRSLRSPLHSINRHAIPDDGSNVIEMVPSKDFSPSESMQSEQSTRAIHRALSILPPEVRAVVVLFLVNGFSYQQIAAVTDSPIGTVMSRLARGRTLLQRELKDYDADITTSRTREGMMGDLP